MFVQLLGVFVVLGDGCLVPMDFFKGKTETLYSNLLEQPGNKHVNCPFHPYNVLTDFEMEVQNVVLKVMPSTRVCYFHFKLKEVVATSTSNRL